MSAPAPPPEGPAAEGASGVLLDEPRRLSRSLLWRAQRSYFEQEGIQAWSQGTVPHYITSNPFIAAAYARVLLGWLRDCSAAATSADAPAPERGPEEPFYLVELGAGSGRFSFHLLLALRRLLSAARLGVRWKYVMTDLSHRNLEYWQAHPALRPLVAEGLLDFARFDAERDETLRLVHGGELLAPGAVKHPLGVIANYFFDGIPHDAFRVRGGRLHESLVSISSRQPEPDLDDPTLLSRIRLSYEDRPVTPDYYEDADLNRILRDYEQRLGDTWFLFPCAALHCLGRLRRLCADRLLLLSCDKGHIREDELLGHEETGLVVHGSFSLMVNYHALAQYALHQGGTVLRVPYRHASLSISAFVLGPGGDGPRETALAFEEAVSRASPDDFYTLKTWVEQRYDAMTLPQLLAFLRLSRFDASVLLGAFPVLLPKVGEAAEPLRQELRWAIQNVWQHHYPIGEPTDLAFHLGMLLYEMRDYGEAVKLFEHSLALCGEDASTHFNLGLCRLRLRDLGAALACFQKALVLRPSFAAAREMLIKTEAELGR